MDRLDKLLKEGKDILYSSKLVSSNWEEVKVLMILKRN